MAGCKSLSLRRLLLIFVLIQIICTSILAEHVTKAASSVIIATKADILYFPSRNSGMSRRYKPNQTIPPCWKVKAVLNLVNLSMCAGYLVLLSGDVSLNPGPLAENTVNRSPKCVSCSKVIRKSQPRLACVSCERSFHLRCLGADFEETQKCRECNVSLSVDLTETFEPENPYISLRLQEISQLRGLKIVHQNIQSLSDKIDELRLLVKGLHSSIQIITLSETWLKSDRNDSEFAMAGYELFRKDRDKGNNGGVAVYIRDDITASRRIGLEMSTGEGIWLGIAVPK